MNVNLLELGWALVSRRQDTGPQRACEQSQQDALEDKHIHPLPPQDEKALRDECKV